MDQENSNGKMEEVIKENIKTIKRMDMVYINGQMEGFLKDIGKKGFKMDKEHLNIKTKL